MISIAWDCEPWLGSPVLFRVVSFWFHQLQRPLPYTPALWWAETCWNLQPGWLPGLVNIQKAIENGHRNSGFTHSKWWFSIVTLVYQDGYILWMVAKSDKPPKGWLKHVETIWIMGINHRFQLVIRISSIHSMITLYDQIFFAVACWSFVLSRDMTPF